MSTSTKRRRLNQPETKAKILAAAQQAFSKLGYSEAGFRDIAKIAGVSPPLLLRYFESKAVLFEAALTDAIPIDTTLPSSLKQNLGEYMARLILDVNLDFKPPSIIALGMGDTEARDIVVRVTRERILGPLADMLGPPDARMRATRILMLALGFLLYTRQIPLLPASKVTEKKMGRWFADAVQAIVDQQ